MGINEKIKISKEKNQLFENFISLSFLQIFNVLIGLILTPYLVRVIGVEYFGLINFALAITMSFNILINFGFNISIPKKIVENINDNKKISELFSTVIIIKSIFLLCIFFVLLILFFFNNSMRENYIIYISYFSILLGNIMFPVWYFQGIEKMKYISIINISFRIFFIILIFFFVKSTNDYIYVPILTSLGYFFGGLYSIIFVLKNFPIHFILPTKNSIYIELRDSFNVFISRLSNQGSRYFSTIIIGISFGDSTLGIYSIVEKIYFTMMIIPSTISQAIFPYMTRTKNLYFIKKVILISALSSILLLVPLIFFRDFIIYSFFNLNSPLLSVLFLIMFSGSLFGFINILIGYPLLGAFGFMEYANKSLIYASVIYFVYIILSTYVFNNIFLAVSSIILFQLASLILRLIYIKKVKIL